MSGFWGFCPPPPPPMQPAVFSYAVWIGRYPEFAGVDPDLAVSYFNEATLYLDNSGYGVIQDPNRQLLILNALTAHIAALYSGVNGQAPSGLVGRVASASEGSVSVSTSYPDSPAGLSAWLQQTPYGAAADAAMAAFRTARYIPARGPGGYGRPW